MSYELGALHHPHARGPYRVLKPRRKLPPKGTAARVFARSSSPRSPFLAIRTHQYGAVHAAYGPAPTPMDTVPMPVQLAPGLSGLGFSLKPPKKIRKAFKAVKKAVTLKRVLTAGAIVAGAALVPGALPLLAKGAVGAGKLAVGAGRLATRGVVGAAKFGAKQIGTAAGILRGRGTPPIAEQAPPPEPIQLPPVSPGDTWGTATEPRQPEPPAPLEPSAPVVTPAYGGGGGGYAMAADTGEAEPPAPSQAGIGGGAVAIAVLAGLALMAASRPRR